VSVLCIQYENLLSKVEDELQNIDHWIKANKLPINYNKINYITLYYIDLNNLCQGEKKLF